MNKEEFEKLKIATEKAEKEGLFGMTGEAREGELRRYNRMRNANIPKSISEYQKQSLKKPSSEASGFSEQPMKEPSQGALENLRRFGTSIVSQAACFVKRFPILFSPSPSVLSTNLDIPLNTLVKGSYLKTS